ncbi:unnamed protein product [Dicrocoelium dendriticum]|nr:unnamed protein product [Dicrocoelium dendriticum]
MDQLKNKLEFIDGNVQCLPNRLLRIHTYGDTGVCEELHEIDGCNHCRANRAAGNAASFANYIGGGTTVICYTNAGCIQQLSKLKGVHGDTLSETVRLMMQRLLTRSLMAEINYSCLRNKHGFRKMKLFTEVQAALLKRFSGSIVSPDDDVRKYLKSIRGNAWRDTTKGCASSQQVFQFVDLERP